MFLLMDWNQSHLPYINTLTLTSISYEITAQSKNYSYVLKLAILNIKLVEEMTSYAKLN